jgi:hypothetical protein
MPRTPSAKISRHPRADIADAIEPIERAEAKKRQREHGGTAPGRKHSGQIAHSEGRALDKVSKAVGKGQRTIEKAPAIRDAAKKNPKKFGAVGLSDKYD